MIQATLDAFIEDRVTALEQSAASDGRVRIEDLLPPPDHPRFTETAVELIRVDLELAWSRGDAKPLSDYRRRFPSVFEDDNAREALAFEEYRQRLEAGERVNPAEYESRYNVVTRQWSNWRGYDDGVRKSTLANGVAGDPTIHAIPSIESEPMERDPVPGKTWGGFHIVRELGRGSFGRTLLATQPALANRQVVLKFPHTSTDEADRLARL